jgi:hypothetical protein
MSAVNSPFDRQLELHVGSSPSLQRWLLAIHLACVLPLALISGSWTFKCALTAIVLASAVFSWRRWGRGDESTVRTLIMRSDGIFHVVTSVFEEPASLIAASVVHSLLTVMVLRGASGRRYSVILCPDNIAAEPFRRLRARLRDGKTVKVANSTASDRDVDRA